MQIASPSGKTYNFKIGADPEFFVKRFGKLVSAHGLIPGNKDEPFPVPKGAVQVDGMALEFNINPAETYEQFEDHMSTVLDTIHGMIPGYEMFVEPVADFGSKYISEQPLEASQLGCNPDYNAYTKLPNPRPDADTPFRTASGHVHIGWTSGVNPDDPNHFEACCALTKSLDIHLGIPSLVWDQDDRRRTLYGAAGAFRPKSYGMEYRVLSNKWINNPLLRKTVYNNTILAIKKTFTAPDHGDTRLYGLTAREIINKTDPHWETAAAMAIENGDVLMPRHYR